MWFQHTFYPLPANSFNSYALKRRIYFTDSKLDGLDDALIQQTQMESFLPISGCVDMKSGIWIATWFAGLLLLFWRLILCDTVVFWNSAIIQDRTRTPGFESWRPNDWATEVSSMAQWSLSKQFLYFIKKVQKLANPLSLANFKTMVTQPWNIKTKHIYFWPTCLDDVIYL